jgi:chaperonin GroES
MSATNINQIKPAVGYILIQAQEQQTQTSGGIYLPDNAKGDKPQSGKVLAVGADDVKDGIKISAPAKAGDTVIYKKWGGNEVKIEGKEYLFVKFEDILAIYGS